jgi:hypothetical protein
MRSQSQLAAAYIQDAVDSFGDMVHDKFGVVLLGLGEILHRSPFTIGPVAVMEVSGIQEKPAYCQADVQPHLPG